MRILCIATTLFVPLLQFSFCHGGGLDSNGGHTDKKTGSYHYHRKTAPVATSTPQVPLISPPANVRPSAITIIEPETFSIVQTNAATVAKGVVVYNGKSWTVHTASWIDGTQGKLRNDVVNSTLKTMNFRFPSNAVSLFATVEYYRQACATNPPESFTRHIVHTTEVNDSGREREYDYLFKWDHSRTLPLLIKVDPQTSTATAFNMRECEIVAQLLQHTDAIKHTYDQRLRRIDNP